MQTIYIAKGGTPNFLINMGFDISSSAWDVMEIVGHENIPAPAIATVSGAAGTARFGWTKSQTEQMVRGSSAIFVLRITLVSGDALPFPQIKVEVT